MKKILGILVCMVLLASGCATNKYNLKEVYHPVLNTQEDVLGWVADNINYVAEVNPTEETTNWQSPLETLMIKEGDCEDYVLLSMYLLNLIDIDSRLILVEVDNKDNGKYIHALLYINGNVYETIDNTSAGPNKYFVVANMSYYEALYMSIYIY